MNRGDCVTIAPDVTVRPSLAHYRDMAGRVENVLDTTAGPYAAVYWPRLRWLSVWKVEQLRVERQNKEAA